MDDAEFAAAIEEAAKVASGEETPTEEVEAVVEEVATEETEPEVQEAQEVVEEPEAPQFSDEVQAYLSKYGGDVPKALEAALHAQSKLGEQGQELGELRRMVQELYERPEPQAPTSPFLSEQAQEAITANPAQVALWAEANQQPQIFEAAMREWYDQDPYQASAYREQRLIQAVAGVVQQGVEPAIQSANQGEQVRLLTEAHRSLATKYPDFQQVLESATADEVAGIDRDLLDSAIKKNPQTALEMVYRYVWAARGQKQAAQSAQRTEQVRTEKREASVVTAEENTPGTTTLTAEERLAKFMLEPDEWSVQHGLTR